MGVDEAHLLAEALGDAGDEILDVADGGANGRRRLPRPEPGVDLELPAAVGELEVKVEVLEVAGELTAGSLDLDYLRLHPDLHPLRDVHHLRHQYGLHLLRRSSPTISFGRATATSGGVHGARENVRVLNGFW